MSLREVSPLAVPRLPGIWPKPETCRIAICSYDSRSGFSWNQVVKSQRRRDSCCINGFEHCSMLYVSGSLAVGRDPPMCRLLRKLGLIVRAAVKAPLKATPDPGMTKRAKLTYVIGCHVPDSQTVSFVRFFELRTGSVYVDLAINRTEWSPIA
jgi:hypothetical protein